MNNKKNDTQLYTLVRKLSFYVPNDDDLSTILGYSIIKSLIDFNTKTTSNKEIKIEEIKTVYGFLENLVHIYEKNENYDASIELVSDIDIEFEKWNSEYIENGKVPSLTSELVGRVVNRKIIGKTKNLSELMRRVGIKIQRETNDLGPYARPIDSLNKDYDTLEYSLDIRGN